MTEHEALQKQVDALASALGHIIGAVQELTCDRNERRFDESVRLAIANMDELNRLRIAV